PASTPTTITKWLRKAAQQHAPQPCVHGGKHRLVHVTEQLREYIRSADRSVDHHADTFTPASNASLEALLMTLAKEMTSSEQKQFTSLLVREGITGSSLRVAIRDSK
uniref:YfeC-like transcriptional regulator n=1 Tax=Salmonella enterica TaxID=28901 RepID=UPI00398C4928